MARIHSSRGKSNSHLNGKIFQAIVTTPCEHCGTHECLLSSTDDEAHRLALLLRDLLFAMGRAPIVALTISPDLAADMNVRSAEFTNAVETLHIPTEDDIAF